MPKKISDMNAAIEVSGDELVPIVQEGANRLASLNDLVWPIGGIVAEQVAEDREAAESANGSAQEAADRANEAATAAGDNARIAVTNLGLVRSFPRSGWVGARVNDQTGRIAEGMRTNGLYWQSGVTRASLEPSISNLLPSSVYPRSGWLGPKINAHTGRVIDGTRASGGGYAATGGLSEVTELSLAAPLKKRLFKERSNVRPVRPDGMQSSEALIGVTTHRSGYIWTRLPFTVGAQYIRNADLGGASTSFQVRKRLKVNMAGLRAMGTWSPGSIASLTSQGVYSNNAAHGVTALPAASAKAEGDYYTVRLQGGGSQAVAGVGTVYNGDVIVNHNAGSGLAWTLQPGPANGLANGALSERDWWEVSDAGTFEGVTYAAGDRIIHFGAAYYHAFKRGRPDLGEMFLRGEHSASAGLEPSSPRAGDVWQITAAGTISGIALAVDDWLLHDGGAFYALPSSAVFVTGTGPFLIPVEGDTSDYEVRRADKSTSTMHFRLRAPVQCAPRFETDDFLFMGDSMTDYVRSAYVAAFADRGVGVADVLGYNSASALEIASMFEFFALTGKFTGRTVVAWLGQNNEGVPHATLSAFLKFYELLAAFDRYLIPVIPAARRQWTFDGAQLVSVWHTPMATRAPANNAMVQVLNAMDSPHWPFRGRYIDPRKVVIEAVMANPAAFAAADPQFPGKTEFETATERGTIPLSMYGTLPVATSYQGFWSSAAMPTGGADGDYYIRSVSTGDNYVGNIIVRTGGVWAEGAQGSANSTVHLGGPNAAIANNAIAAAVRSLVDTLDW